MREKKWFLAFIPDQNETNEPLAAQIVVISKPFYSMEEAMEEYEKLGDRSGVSICETVYG